jgi:hypothetical protein
MPEEYDSWTRAPVLEARPLLSTGMKRRGDSLPAWRFAFCALGDHRTSRMTCGAGPPHHRLGALVCIGGDFSWPFKARAEESAFKKGVHPSSSSHAFTSLSLAVSFRLRALCLMSP